ncbi:hypothetical protein D2Q93_04200 [Alicyclobacillaceae bacterium I2511]|nr:hypothetical protein D2Q93_04200 [Alicyclobacillaceae bacterium I2511]
MKNPYQDKHKGHNLNSTPQREVLMREIQRLLDEGLITVVGEYEGQPVYLPTQPANGPLVQKRLKSVLEGTSKK